MAKKSFQVIDEVPKGADVLSIRYVALSTIIQWDRNYKKHDIGGVIASIKAHGFKDPFKYEPTLNKGKGGVVEGNGRTEALQEWKKLYDQKEKGYTELPRGILEKDKEWYAPMLFGVDAASQSAAEAYAIDHNNLTMSGGDFSFADIMGMWTSDVIKVLADLPVMPVSIEGVNAEMLQMMVDGMIDNGGQDSGKSGEERTHVFRVRVKADDLIEEVGASLVALCKKKDWGDNVVLEA